MRRGGAAAARGRGGAVVAAVLAACTPKASPGERRDGGALGARDARAPAAASASDAARSDAASDAALADAAPDRADPAALAAMAAAGYRVDEAAAAGGGGVRVFVRWPDIPPARRASPGEGACGPRPPSVAVDELWGLAEVAVLLAVDRGKAWPTAAPARLTVGACAVAPRAVVAAPGQPIVLESGAPIVGRVHVERRAWHGLGPGGAVVGTSELELPWLGHAAVLRAPSAETWLVESQGSGALTRGDGAVVFVAPHPYVAVTDADGLAVLSEVPAGEHQVLAHLPARGGARGHSFSGKVTVVPGQVAEVVITP